MIQEKVLLRIAFGSFSMPSARIDYFLKLVYCCVVLEYHAFKPPAYSTKHIQTKQKRRARSSSNPRAYKNNEGLHLCPDVVLSAEEWKCKRGCSGLLSTPSMPSRL
jgi:hypothetical protein